MVLCYCRLNFLFQKTHSAHLEETVAAVRNEGEKKLEALEEKLQLHIKTLEIMVAEKTELQNALMRSCLLYTSRCV